MGNFCTCCDSCRDGARQDFGDKEFVSIPKGSKTNQVEIDFHNFKVATAQKLLNDLLTKYSNPKYNPNVTELHLIVGAGNHCEGGAGGRKIYPMVYEEIQQKYSSIYTAKDHPKNPGVVIAERINLGTKEKAVEYK